MKDILAEFDKLLRFSGEEGITTAELAVAKGCSDLTARRAIKQKIADGSCEYAGKKKMEDMSGRWVSVACYRLTDKKSPTAKARRVSSR